MKKYRALLICCLVYSFWSFRKISPPPGTLQRSFHRGSTQILTSLCGMGLGQLCWSIDFDFSKHYCNLNSFRLFYFLCAGVWPVYMSVHHIHCLVPGRLHQTLWNWSQTVVSHPVGVGNLIWVHLKGSNCSDQQSQFYELIAYFFTTTKLTEKNLQRRCILGGK